jgi:hypothetical protein
MKGSSIKRAHQDQNAEAADGCRLFRFHDVLDDDLRQLNHKLFELLVLLPKQTKLIWLGTESGALVAVVRSLFRQIGAGHVRSPFPSSRA